MRPNNFDLIRLLAALQVVLYHGLEHLRISEGFSQWFTVIPRCFPGVPIFFVISGFLVSASYRRSNTIGKSSVNRSLRIYPGLWVCLVVAIASVAVLMPEVFEGLSFFEFFAWIAAQVSIVQFYNPDFLRPYGLGALNGSLWTIPVELQFYIMLPIVCFLFGTKKQIKNKTLLMLIVIFLAMNQFQLHGLRPYYGTFWYKILRCTFLPHFWLFLVGVAFQQNFERLLPYFEGKFFYWSLVHAAAVGLAIFLGQSYGSNFPFPVVGLSLAGLTMSFAYTCRGLADQLLNHNDISYGVYIYHGLVINAFVHLGLVGSLSNLFWLFVITIVLAYLSWRFVERPCMKLKKRFQTPTTNTPHPQTL